MSPEKVAQVFDAWATTGRAESMEIDHGSRMASVMATLPTRPTDHVLDLGSGNGWMTRALAARVPEGTALGVDLSPEMVERATQQSSDLQNISFQACDLSSLPLEDASIDHVVSMEVLYYVDDLEAALKEVARVLRSSGTVTIGVDYYQENRHSHEWPSLMDLPMHLLSEDRWEASLRDAGLVQVHRFRALAPPVKGGPDEDTEDFLTQVGTLVVRGAKPQVSGPGG